MIEIPADTLLTNGEHSENEPSSQSEGKTEMEISKIPTLAKNKDDLSVKATETGDSGDASKRLSNEDTLPGNYGLPTSLSNKTDNSDTGNINKPNTTSTMKLNHTPDECNKHEETSQSDEKLEINNRIEEFTSALENKDEFNMDLQTKAAQDKMLGINQLIDLKLDEMGLHLNPDENMIINDTRQTADALLHSTSNDLPTQNDVHNENSSLIGNVDESEDNTGLLIDIELPSSNQNELHSSVLENENITDIKTNLVVTSDISMDKDSDGSQSETNFQTVNNVLISDESFDSKTGSQNSLDCKTDYETKHDSVGNEKNEKLGQNSVDEIDDEKSKQDLETRESVNMSDKDLPMTQKNSADPKGMELVKSNQDLKEKIGNSLKSIFENNDHLNLLEKQNIANLQSNTMKKVNNLFSSFKSYNFSNFRNSEENQLAKDKQSPSKMCKENNTSIEQSETPQENSKHSARPQQNSPEYNLNSDAMKITLKEGTDDIAAIVNSNRLLNNDIVQDINQETNRIPRGLNNSTPDLLHEKTVRPSDSLETFQAKDHASEDNSPVVRVEDSFVFNTQLIQSVKNACVNNSHSSGNNTNLSNVSSSGNYHSHPSTASNSGNNHANPSDDSNSGNNTDPSNVSNCGNNHSYHTHTVQNASHVPNKSISLNSSPVRNASQHDLQDELYLLKETNIRLLGEISWLEEEKNKMKKDFRTFLEETELYKKSMNEQIMEHERWKETNKVLQEQEKKNMAQSKKELETKLDKLKKDLDSATREMEAAVMRYVTKESELIAVGKEREALDKKYKEAVKEKENMVAKVKVLATDKARLTQLFDDKCTECNIMQRNLDKMSSETTGKDIKLKWVQSKLDRELDTSRQLADKLKAAEEKLKSAVEEETQRKFSEDSHRLFLQEIDALKKKQHAVTEENNALSVKVQRLEKERLESEEAVSKCKGVVISQNEQISALRNQLANMEDLKNQLHVEHERVLAKESEVDRVQLSNQELSQDMTTCRAREAELLQFTEKLTAKNVRLQSEFSVLEAKAERLEMDVAPLNARIQFLESEVASLQSQVDAEKSSKDGDNKALARVVAEKTKQVEVMARDLEELRSESQILKRKHASTVRELNKELSSLKRKCESLTNNTDAVGGSLGDGSRTSSCQSLNEAQHSSTSASVASTLSSTLQTEPDRAVIIDRFVELQRAHARTIEKLEFFEEHNAQLVNELQRKTRILQNYILREQSGTLSSTSMDVNKAELSRHGGIMASLYSSRPVDGGMTLELSLEINRKLQAVLEDIILKNITLKENIDTLGEQIEKLSRKS